MKDGHLHEVYLEFLRHGPSHGQLLSTVGSYLALCGQEGAATISPPFDHAELQDRLRPLHYRRWKDRRSIELLELGVKMRDLLASVPGLAPSLASARESGSSLAHLRLVLTPNELALLPFECALNPPGAPGGPGYMFVQSDAPVTVTREVRGISAARLKWPTEPKILFVWAEPDEFSPVPHGAHLDALMRAISVWLPPHDPSHGEHSSEHRLAAIRERLTIVPHATLAKVAEACSTNAFTHVHILAHGKSKESRPGREEVGLALHHASDPTKADWVSGQGLINALRLRNSIPSKPTARPAMVTIASCNGGQITSIMHQGASMAHDLHVAGVPVVIASQFPLTKSGSVQMVQELYQRILHGEDVRVALHATRRRLFVQSERHHDWASLVAYVSLPDDIGEKFAELQQEVKRLGVELALKRIDQALFPSGPVQGSANNGMSKPKEEEVQSLIDALEEPLAELVQWDRRTKTARAAGILGSTYKRRAQLRFAAVLKGNKNGGSNKVKSEASLEKAARARRDGLLDLRLARDYYQTAMRRDLSGVWAYAQYLVLSAVLHHEGIDPKPVTSEMVESAKELAELYRQQGVHLEDPTLHVSAAELELLGWVIDRCPKESQDECAKAIKVHMDRFVQACEPGEFRVYASWRQFQRYIDWWRHPLSQSTGSTKKTPLESFYHLGDSSDLAAAAQGAIPMSYLPERFTPISLR